MKRIYFPESFDGEASSLDTNYRLEDLLSGEIALDDLGDDDAELLALEDDAAWA